MVRAVKFYKSALTRQLGEAVRIRRRGGQGNILNSKSEYDRCKIPRLTIDEKEEELNKMAEKKEQEKLNVILEQLDKEEQAWGATKNTKRNELMRAESLELGPAGMSRSKKREQQTKQKGARSKKLRYAILEEEWGKEQPEPKSPSHQTPPPPSQ